jgi:hypothetical protein
MAVSFDGRDEFLRWLSRSLWTGMTIEKLPGGEDRAFVVITRPGLSIRLPRRSPTMCVKGSGSSRRLGVIASRLLKSSNLKLERKRRSQK